MNSCIKCQSSLSAESKFCRKCGTEQVVKSEQRAEPDAITTSFNTSDNKINETTSTDYSTKKMTTLPLALSTHALPTMPMTQVIEEKRKHGLFIAGAIFLLMAVFGAIMTYVVINRLNYLRSTPPSITNKPPSSKPTGKVEVNVATLTENSNPTNKPLEPPEPLSTNQGIDTLPTPKISPPTPMPNPPIKEKPIVEPTSIPSPEIETPVEDGQITEVGVLGVKFKLVGKALVKIKGKEISVIPLIDSSVMDVSRLVINPLPNAPAFVVGRQRASDPVEINTIEKPLPRNNFTATFAVESKARDVNQAVIVELGLRWQALPRLERK